MDFVNLKKEDKEIYDLMKKELKRQEKGIELIASENLYQGLLWRRWDHI